MEGTDDCPFEGESEQRAAPQQSQHGGRAKLGQLGKATSVQVEATAPAAAPSLRFMPRGRSVDVAPVPEEAEAPMFGKRKEFIRLKNLLTGQDTVDTLHQSGIMVSQSIASQYSPIRLLMLGKCLFCACLPVHVVHRILLNSW